MTPTFNIFFVFMFNIKINYELGAEKANDDYAGIFSKFRSLIHFLLTSF